MSNILVLGASGYVGTHLVPALVDRGHRVRASSRRRDTLEARGWNDVEVVAADALDGASLDRALEGIEIAYYLVHSMAAGARFAEIDRAAAVTFREAAERSGVRRIVYLGGLQPDGEASAHLRSRRETGDLLRAGSVPVTELRAGIIVGPGSAAFEVIRDLVYHLPLMVTPRWVRSRSQPIALDDLITYLVRLPDLDETEGHTYDAVGVDTLTYQELMQQFARVARRPLFIIPVPVLSPRLSSYWLDLITAAPASVARPLIDGLAHDLVSTNPWPLREAIPLRLRGYEQAVRAALAEEEAAGPPARWTEGAFRLRQQRHDISFYDKRSRAEVHVNAPPEAVWAEVSAIGGDRGWYYANTLWWLRGLLDRLAGGVGMRRGRRHPRDLRVGDTLVWWRVEAVEPGRRLTLLAEMKLPGSAVLEFVVTPVGDGASITTQAHFHPAGMPGLLYWYALWPVHSRIFDGLTRAIAARAEAASRASNGDFGATASA
ncbi:MAG: SDR family oxidoreductase [Chloroflexi bacterium]|nr:SDR family oxidoreductase [Chloroflexota bacterium]